MTTELTPTTYPVTREALVAYAAASGDPNPIHQDPEVARSVGLPDVIAHGMYTLALAARYVDELGLGRRPDPGPRGPAQAECGVVGEPLRHAGPPRGCRARSRPGR
jgi:acyl dehydratase